MWRAIRYSFYTLIGLALGFLVFEAATFPRISTLARENPATTSMIESRLREAQKQGAPPRRMQVWVPLERISSNLQRAVLAGEDRDFATHHGFDYQAIQRAWEDAQREAERDARKEGDDDSWIPPMP